MSERSDFLRTLGFAESALAHLRRHELPATPRNFEFWYVYAAGFNPPFCHAVNDIIRLRGRIDIDDMQHLHGIFLSQGQLGDRIEEIGDRLTTEISEISASIAATLTETATYGANLAVTIARLSETGSIDEALQTLDRLVEATQKIEAQKIRLDARLIESNAHFEALQSNLESIRYESMSDPLTTLSARRHFDQEIERAVAEAAAIGAPLSLILTDIDHFKSFNDRFGHQTGDHVLRLVAQATKQNIKGLDIACRYGGEEFAIILRQTSEARAIEVGEQIRQAVMGREMVKRSTGENIGHVTVSVGIASHRPDDTSQSLIERADACLYAAKRAGRNRVVAESTPQAALDVA
ncbi:GGDEF domain-containing protein [Kaistia algarum]|uniref:GGDEF domain-containing protein n=1 Tax=Kaistia algarum TaxID=2083279 RepID=UPI000CE7D3A3|nr:GGDEF domain-containing protein [Kaistia algarum]MCX5515179.1 GGDEF domain-containing protein [Kaistia algarum]PPE79898.1 GGDEF domain-containing protein [Kaistia algarum]